MTFNGSGTFVRLYDWTTDAANNVKIRADRMDDEMDGMATGLSTCITKDGQTTLTANIPFSGRKITGYGSTSAPSNRTDVPVLSNVQDGLLNWVDGGGTADAITATYGIALTSLSDGQLCFVRATAANATTTPTFSPNGLTARTIVKNGGAALVAGDIVGDGHELILRYDLSNTRWELLNPAYTATSLGLVIGTDVQAWDADLDSWAGKTAPSGTVVGTTDTQTLTNKTITAPIISSPNIMVNDDGFTLRDNADITKQMNFQLSGITTGNTRTISAPDSNVAIGNIVKWTAFTPTITTGSGTMTNHTDTGFYRRIGDSMHVRVAITFTGAAGTWSVPSVTLPLSAEIDTAKLASTATWAVLGVGIALDAGTNGYPLQAAYNGSATAVLVQALNASGTYLALAGITQAVPFSFGSGDAIVFEFVVPISGWTI